MSAFIAKPSDDIPDGEWQALSLSQQAFAEFVYEVLDYFNVVVRERLGWTPENLRINQGRNNIVLGFEWQAQRYLFRVPKHGHKQLEQHALAVQHFGHFDFFIDQVYADSKCIIERFAPGDSLNHDAPEAAYIALAKALNKIHSNTAKHFGPMSSKILNHGEHFSASDHYLAPMTDAIRSLSMEIPDQAQEFHRLFQLWQLTLRGIKKPTVICHGDLWSDNVLYDPEAEKLTLIDWDTFGVYHREKDLHFLLSDDVPSVYKKRFFEVYDYDVDLALMSWYRLTMNVIYYKPDRSLHLVEAANHFFNLMGSSERLNIALFPSISSEQGQ